ncbi:MAG: hypothetical protein AAGA56_27600, partial [Myxococcota bacterium]
MTGRGLRTASAELMLPRSALLGLVLSNFLLLSLACGSRPPTAETGALEAPSARGSGEPGPPSPASDYRFLEDTAGARTERWVRARDRAARATLAALPSRPGFRKEVAKYIQLGELSRPWRTQTGMLYYRRKLPGKDHRILVRSPVYGERSREELVLDPNSWSADGRKSLQSWRFSHDEQLLAFSESNGGSDWTTWFVLDLKTLERRPDELRGIKWDSPSFTPDNAGLFYTGYENRSHSETAEGTQSRIYYHRLGDRQQADIVVYTPKDPEWIARADVQEQGAYVVVRLYKSSDGRNRLEVFAWPGRTKSTPADVASVFANDPPHVLSPDFAYRQWEVSLERDAIYLFSEEDAPTGKVDRYTLSTRKLETVIPSRAET